jgi:hypothetical protein
MEDKKHLVNFNHLKEVNESYFEHLRFNLWITCSVTVLAVVSLIHAIFPFLMSRWPHAISKYIFKKSLSRTMTVGREIRNK